MLAAQISPKHHQHVSKDVPKLIPRRLRNKCRISSWIWYAFWIKNELQKDTQMAPKLAPKMVCETRIEKGSKKTPNMTKRACYIPHSRRFPPDNPLRGLSP